MMRFEKEDSHIRTHIIREDIDYQIDMHLKKNKTKGIAVNGITIKKAAYLFGIVNFVFFSPEDLNLLKNGPGERRRFLNMELCQLSSVYLYNLNCYKKVIKQRNLLLKDMYFKPELRETLDLWDEQLVKYGLEIIKERKKFIDELNLIIQDIHKKLSGNKEELRLEYVPNVNEENFYDSLVKNREKDVKYKMTSVGPHRDDMYFYVGDMDVIKYGSQGQKRTCALSLKLSEIQLVKRVTKDDPVLLLDDVLSELDSNRQNFLLKSIENVQTLISCTGLDDFVKNRFQINKIFHVTEGTVTNEN